MNDTKRRLNTLAHRLGRRLPVPVMFFVPDLENYLSSRRVLFDFAPTAPGPLLSTITEVAEALLDLGSVVSKYAAARELFNKEFNRLHDGHAAERVLDAFF
jgi:CDP-glycerol glycerophosphotransferase